MKATFLAFLKPDKWVRLLADVVMVNVSLALALVVWYIWLVNFSTIKSPHEGVFFKLFGHYSTSALVITLIALVVFSLSGFYTSGRAYQGRYKILVVVQAVTLSYVLFVMVSYVVSNTVIYLPRGVFLLGWLFTTLIVVLARLWSAVWKMQHMHPSPYLDESVEKILVIGGAGYIGSALLPFLLKRGYKVRLLDLLMYGTEPIQGFLEHPNLEVMQADFRQVDKVVQAMNGVDAVVHLGAIVGDPACAFDEKLTIEVNLMATRMVAEVAKACGVRRFVFASTCSVYGAGDEILNETSPLNPVSLYAESKIASERILHPMAEDSFSPTLLRFGTIYGFSGRVRFDLVVETY